MKKIILQGIVFVILVLLVSCTNVDDKISDEIKDSSKQNQVVEKTTIKEPALLSAVWLMDTEFDDYELLNSSGDEESCVLFVPDKEIKDFKVYSLTYVDVDNDGNVFFDASEVCCTDKVTPKRPAAVYMLFGGTIPNNGISYIDTDGSTRYYTVSISGMDGSVVLAEQTKGF